MLIPVLEDYRCPRSFGTGAFVYRELEMNEHRSIKLKAWKSDSHCIEETGESLSAHQVA